MKLAAFKLLALVSVASLYNSHGVEKLYAVSYMQLKNIDSASKNELCTCLLEPIHSLSPSA